MIVFLLQIKLLMAGLLLALAENFPLGILQLVYSQRIATKMGKLDMFSLITSWCPFFGQHSCLFAHFAVHCSLMTPLIVSRHEVVPYFKHALNCSQ